MNSQEVADFLGAEHHGDLVELVGVGPLEEAGPGELAFAEDKVSGEAGVVICKAPVAGRTCLVVEDPKLAFIHVLNATVAMDPPASGVHPTAQVEGELGDDVFVGAYAVIGAGTTVHDRAVIHAHVVVGRECTIGAGTVLHPHVTLYDHSWIGQDCIVHGGAVLGSDGFSFHPTADGVVKVPQVGRVVVHDGVEIGANTTVDRAFLRETVLGQGTKLDNLVQIGHNSKIGRSNLFAAQVGLSGSVTTGDGVVLAGKVGVGDHAQLEDGVIAGAGAGLLGRVKTGTWWGFPASEIRLAKRMAMAARQLPALLKTVRALERRLAALEEGNPEADG